MRMKSHAWAAWRREALDGATKKSAPNGDRTANDACAMQH